MIDIGVDGDLSRLSSYGPIAETLSRLKHDHHLDTRQNRKWMIRRQSESVMSLLSLRSQAAYSVLTNFDLRARFLR